MTRIKTSAAIVMFPVLTGCGNVVDSKLPGGYAAWAIDASEQTTIWDSRDKSPSGPVVPASVEAIGWSGTYIVAKWHPMGRENGVSWPDGTITKYWLIDTKSRTVAGPMDEIKWIAEKQRLNLPDILLRPVLELE